MGARKQTRKSGKDSKRKKRARSASSSTSDEQGEDVTLMHAIAASFGVKLVRNTHARSWMPNA